MIVFSSKTTLIEFNPLVENLVLVGGYDIGTGKEIIDIYGEFYRKRINIL